MILDCLCSFLMSEEMVISFENLDTGCNGILTSLNCK